MTGWRTAQFRLVRRLGRLTVRLAAVLTLGRMPSFVSASALVFRDGLVLTVMDPIRREPVLPGGHLKWDENPVDAMVREVREETGLAVRQTGIVGVFAGREWAGEPGIVRVIYRAEETGGTLQSSPEGEASWTSVDDMLSSRARDASIVKYCLERGLAAPVR